MAPLYTGGALEAQERSSRAMRGAAVEDANETREDVLLEVAQDYFAVLKAEEQAAAAASYLESAEEMARQSRSQLEAGKGIASSVQRAEAEVSVAKVTQASALGEEEDALLDLKAAMGLPLGSAIVVDAADHVDGQIKPLDSYLAEAAQHRSALAAAKARVSSAEADLRAALGVGSPQLYAVAAADSATRSSMSGAAVGLTLSLPLFDGGERSAGIARARAARDKARFALTGAQLAVERDVRKAYLDLNTAAAKEASAQDEFESASASYDIAVLRVQNGKAILVEQLDALQALSRARADSLSAKYDREAATDRLLRAAGLPLARGAR
jgi:outer membrane protein